MGAGHFAGSVALLFLVVASGVSARADQRPLPPKFLAQGAEWTPAARASFYSQDQGSKIIPLAWLKAIETPDGRPFLYDQLARYGYLVDPNATDQLPIGFTASGPEGSKVAGMTCAACHTRDIDVQGTTYRVDGGPALADFQSFLSDMVEGVGRVLASDASFGTFAEAVLGGPPTQVELDELKESVALWYLRENTLKEKAYGTANMWGLGRVDAVSMIFNRLTGMDIGPAPTYLIPENIRPADAPVRYPFLWNTSKQDFTQWTGFAANGNEPLAMARNLGQVYGVFGIVRPAKSRWHPGGIDLLNGNSANFDGLGKLERLAARIGAPEWRWRVDRSLAAKGQQVWNKPSLDNKSCADCHDETRGADRAFSSGTWATPIVNVNTDTRTWSVLTRPAKSGVLEGGEFLWFGRPIAEKDAAIRVMGFMVVGSMVQNYSSFRSQPLTDAQVRAATTKLPAPLADLGVLSPAVRSKVKPASVYAYEARVLRGIWAAAPYLHNGSVPTLADLLKPSDLRPKTFKVGGHYDLKRVGLAPDQPGNYVMMTTGCEARDSGNSRCGHEYGTQFTEAEKAALIEYLKIL